MKTLFVTGRLAEPALRAVLAELAPSLSFEAEVAVLPISVAALMTTRWAARHLGKQEDVARVILPGYCRGELQLIEEAVGCPVERGPADLRDLPRFLGGSAEPDDYGAYAIEILAEINHATSLSTEDVVAIAEHYRASGADIIDVGCTPGERSPRVGPIVAALRERGFRVSIDTFDPVEVADAVAAGAELVLSVNGSNRNRARDWGVEVVAIPDRPGTLDGLEETLKFLSTNSIPFRLDPILEPLGFGFAASLGRYLEVRHRWPEASVMMGVGNLSELTDVDSGGLNTLLIGFCEEVGVRSVLTTEVINWARSSVAEIDLARRLMHHAVSRRRLPKHVEPRLVCLRDPKVPRFGPEALAEMSARIKDENWRIFAEDGRIVAMNGRTMLADADPFQLFDAMGVDDASHAFYLGYEMMKAKTALTLSKGYRQDQALDWGFLTEPEESHRERRRRAASEEAP